MAHEDATPRSLEPIVRCHPTKPRPWPPKLQFLTTSAAPQTQSIRAPLRSILRQPAFSRKHRSRLRVQRRLGILRRLCATASLNEVVLIRPTKGASSGVAATRTARFPPRARRPTNTNRHSLPSWPLTMRMNDARQRYRQPKLFNPHRPPPCYFVEAAPRDRSIRLLYLPGTRLLRNYKPQQSSKNRELDRELPQRLEPYR